MARRWAQLPAIAAGLLLLAGAGWTLQDSLFAMPQVRHVTAVGEHIPVALSDGSQVRLNTDTVIEVDPASNPRHVRLLHGQAWFEVHADRQHPFIVETPAGNIRVTGTRFDVRIIGDSSMVSLEEGRVELLPRHESPNDPALTLTPGQQARLSPHAVTEVRRFDSPTVTAWLRGQLVFYDAPLAEVIDEMNRYRSGHILVTNPALENLKVSGVFSTAEPDGALDVIANTLPVTITRLTDYLVLLH
jgi:transmembrane sensor